MVATNQRASLALVLAHEGGSVDDPRDAGGRTRKGVTQRVYDAWRQERGQPKRDVFMISMPEVRAIYLEQYWRHVRADELPSGLDYAVFDAAVNSGPVQAVKWLQRALGGIAVDGVVGKVTLAAVRAHPDMAVLVARLCERRMSFLKQLRTWKHFGRGWTRRVRDVESAALSMAAGTRRSVKAMPAAGGSLVGAERADGSQLRKVRGMGAAQTIAGAGLATAAAAEAFGRTLHDAAQEIGAAALTLPAFETLISWLTATGALMLAAGVCWRLYLGWRKSMLDDVADDVAADGRGKALASGWRTVIGAGAIR